MAKPLEAICLKAMAKRPEDRYADAEDLAVDIELSRVNLANREFLDDNAGLAEELLYGCPSICGTGSGRTCSGSLISSSTRL